MFGWGGVGESCHNSQWVYGAGNVYAYTTGQFLLTPEANSPLGLRTFYCEGPTAHARTPLSRLPSPAGRADSDRRPCNF